MSLDGLRAWIGEVERKLGMRTRVFLVLVAIAVGGAGAATYLAIDARDSAVSESDVRELQEQLEAEIGSGGTGSQDLTALEAEIDALRTQIDQLEGNQGSKGTSGGGGPKAPEEGTGGIGGGASGTGGASADRLRDLVEQAKEENEKAEEAE